jgi:hypothetical protein
MKSLLNHRLFRFALGVGISMSWVNIVKAQDASSLPTDSVIFCNSFILTLQNQPDQIPNYSQEISACNETQKAYKRWSEKELDEQGRCEFDEQLNNQTGADCLKNVTPAEYDRTQLNR